MSRNEWSGRGGKLALRGGGGLGGVAVGGIFLVQVLKDVAVRVVLHGCLLCGRSEFLQECGGLGVVVVEFVDDTGVVLVEWGGGLGGRRSS